MHHIISHDIPNDKRRTKLARLLLDFGDRVQYSVFEARLEQKLFDKLIQRINRVIKDQEDSVPIYPMCAICQKGMMIIGKDQVVEDQDVYIL